MEVVPGKGARRCRCRTEERQVKLFAATRIPSRYERCSFANYRPVSGNGTQLQAFNCAFKLVDEYPAIDRGYCHGSVAPGKRTYQRQSCAAIENGSPSILNSGRLKEIRFIQPGFETSD